MNDYSFGNFIYKKRVKAGYTQEELGEMLGVSGKAVSKWENGSAKPRTEIIRKMALALGVSIDEILKLRNDSKKKSITKIVITGGPCAGKTTGLSWIQNAFTRIGYTVLFISEAATDLISGGAAPKNFTSAVEFQKCLLELQLKKESVFEQAASSMNADKILIVCDRGALDNKAYMNNAHFSYVLNMLDKNEVELRDGYDAVFHLVTAAKGAREFYTCENNTARTETPEEAAVLDDKLINAWTGHPHLRVIDNSGGFEEKMMHLIKEISSFLGEPEPYEIERKFLIEYPNIRELEKMPNCEMVEIIQTYLLSKKDEEIRIRQRGYSGYYIYFETIKRKISGEKRIEIEKRLTKDEYLSRLMLADPLRRPIRKNRYCLTDNNKYYEIDIYPFWNDKAILEIELTDENDEPVIPKMFRVIKEVTDDDSYKNASLAKIR